VAATAAGKRNGGINHGVMAQHKYRAAIIERRKLTRQPLRVARCSSISAAKLHIGSSIMA